MNNLKKTDILNYLYQIIQTKEDAVALAALVAEKRIEITFREIARQHAEEQEAAQ